MEQSSFERIFGEYLEEPYHSLFKECELLRIDADRASGEIRIQAKSDRLIEMGHINQCTLQLAQKANLKKVGLTMKYLPTLFTAEYLPSIVCELKTLSGVVNGFFEGAEAELSGQELLIRLKNGGREILQQAGVDKLIEKIVRDHFSLSLAVSFLEEGTLDVSQLEPPPVVVREPIPAAHPAPAPQQRWNGGSGGSFSRRGGAIKDPPEEISIDFSQLQFKKDALLLKGRKITDAPTPLKDVNASSGTVVVWGDIFASQAKVTRAGDKVILT